MTDQSSAAPPAPQIPFVFHGDAREYFGIWIVNTLLTIATLGIFSAWAKVRTRRWFLGSTEFAGSAFAYHATGLQILKGRLIAFAALGTVNILSGAIRRPEVGLALTLILILLLPWAINQGLRFNAHVTSWRTVRFAFQGSYWGAALTYLVLPTALVAIAGALVMLAIATLGAPAGELVGGAVAFAILAPGSVFIAFVIVAPLLTARAKRYVINGSSFGRAPFETDATTAMFRRVLIRYIVIGFAAIALFGIAGAGLIAEAISAVQSGPKPDPAAFALLAVASYAMLILVIQPCWLAYGARATNLALTRTTLVGGHRLRCWIPPWGWAWVATSGIVAAILTVGLLWPWAKVRMWRYKVQALAIQPAGPVDAFLDDLKSAPDAFGGEFGEAMGVDFGF